MEYSKISWDWKSRPSMEELEAALKPFGILVYQDSTFVGTDGFGYILSNLPLSVAELRDIEESE